MVYLFAFCVLGSGFLFFAQAQPADSVRGDSVSTDTIGTNAIHTAPVPDNFPVEIATLPAIMGTKHGPFSLANSISFGNVLSYFYYREIIGLNETVSDFTKTFNAPPDVVIGQPKSTESGNTVSLNVSYTRVNRNRHLFGRPSIELNFGSDSYDGSSQAKLIGTGQETPIGIRYVPQQAFQNNLFFRGNLDIGYCNSDRLLTWAVYSGLNLKTWYRDLSPENSDNDYNVSFSETYWTYCVPLGVELYFPVAPRFFVGTRCAVDFMFFGYMATAFSLTDPNGEKVDTYEEQFDDVTLGNKAQYRAELILAGYFGDKVSLWVLPYVFAYSFGKSTTGSARQIENGIVTASGKFYEPASGTLFYGIHFAVAISFSPLSYGKK